MQADLIHHSREKPLVFLHMQGSDHIRAEPGRVPRLLFEQALNYPVRVQVRDRDEIRNLLDVERLLTILENRASQIT